MMKADKVYHGIGELKPGSSFGMIGDGAPEKNPWEKVKELTGSKEVG